MPKQRIVVIDDSPTVCIFLDMNLQRAGYEVRCYQDPREVFQAFFVDQTPLPDLVIVDLMLPYIDGYRLIKLFRQRSRNLPIVVLSRLDGQGDRLNARLAGATAYMAKPFQAQDMVTLIRQLLKKKVVFEPNTALRKQFTARSPQSREILVDFGKVPQDAEDRKSWHAEVMRFITVLSQHGYLFWGVEFDEASNLCPLYAVQLNRRDFQGPGSVDLPYLQRVIYQTRLCQPGQTTRIDGRILEIHVLGDEPSLG